MTSAETEPEVSTECTDDDVAHWTCCEDENIGKCGKDLTGRPALPPDDPRPVCDLCAELHKVKCPKQGFCYVAILRGLV